ncbi:ribonuclease BN family protein [Rhodoplanes sp. Z2-YC6860]|nr:ribonuclease BN family protein [Rhodoplanes sp. Z2-YC6860]
MSGASERRTAELRSGAPKKRERLTSGTSEDRGRGAETPAEIPATGWKDIVVRVYQDIGDDRIVAIAAGVTFFVLLALFPGIAGLISIYGLFADPGKMAEHLNALAGILPEGGTQILSEQIKLLTAQPPQKLGLAMVAGLAISLWSANGGIKAMFDALNVVYRERERRNFIVLNLQSLTFTLGALAFVMVSLLVIAVIPALLEASSLSRAGELLIKIGRWPLLFVGASFFIALVFRFGPSRDKPKWRWITPGCMFAAGGWLAASLLFSWYAENFGNYNKTYGSLGAAIGFMTWLWISVIVILVGAKLNAEIEHQTARDTTVGRPRPLGERGARMADTVGESAH